MRHSYNPSGHVQPLTYPRDHAPRTQRLSQAVQEHALLVVGWVGGGARHRTGRTTGRRRARSCVIRGTHGHASLVLALAWQESLLDVHPPLTPHHHMHTHTHRNGPHAHPCGYGCRCRCGGAFGLWVLFARRRPDQLCGGAARGAQGELPASLGNGSDGER